MRGRADTATFCPPAIGHESLTPGPASLGGKLPGEQSQGANEAWGPGAALP